MGRTSDFDDTDGHLGQHLRSIGIAVGTLRDPVVLRPIAGIVVAALILVWPSRTDEILARLIGLGLAVLAGITLWGSLRHRPVDMIRAGGAVVLLTIGLSLLTAPPNEAVDLLAVGLGLLAIAVAVRLIIDVVRNRRPERAWPLAQAGLLAGIGLLLIRFPDTLLDAVIAGFALAWLALGVIVIAKTITQTEPDLRAGSSSDEPVEAPASTPVSYVDATTIVAEWLSERPKNADDRQELYAKILYEGPSASKRIGRFFTLMGFASVIAAGGVIADSTAVVIGAMLIAPLMIPLMGMAVSLVMGWPNQLTRSALVAGGGILFAIAIGLIIGLLSTTAIDTANNSQIVARTSPTTLDLLVAVAAGAAGAYGLSRPDVSDSLPGVAIAISLVPPLSVVGISFSQGDWSSGAGALLLFATNALAILFVGGLTFVITGVTPIERLTTNQERTKTTLAAIAGIGTFVVGALLLNGSEVARNVAVQGDVERAVTAWLEPYESHDAVETTIDGDTVTVVVIGPSDASPPALPLANRLSADLGREVSAVVRLVVEERDTATGITPP
jgi:uncharacterized hydrophobic protein (TIGR00271 family)